MLTSRLEKYRGSEPLYFTKTPRERSSSNDNEIKLTKLKSKNGLSQMSRHGLELLVDQLQTQLQQQHLISQEQQIKIEKLN